MGGISHYSKVVTFSCKFFRKFIYVNGGISPYSKVVTFSCKFLRNFMMFLVGIFFNIFDTYFILFLL